MRFARFGKEGSHCEGGEEEDGGERGNDGNVEVEVKSGEEAKAGVSEVWSLYNSEKRTLFFYQIYLLSPQFCKDKPFTSWPAYIWN